MDSKVAETVKVLRGIAKEHGLKGYSRMRKNQLVELIETNTTRKFKRVEKTPTIKELHKTARDMGMRKIARLTKGELMRRLDEKLEEIRREEGIYFEVEGPKQALKGALTTWHFNPLIQVDVETFLEKTMPRRKEIIDGMRKKGTKVDEILEIQFVKMDPTGTRENDEKVGYFHSGYVVMNRGTDVLEELKAMDEKIGEKIAQWTSEKSGWTLKKILRLSLNTDKYSPLTGSQYLALPKWIRDKKAVINVKNDDDECFQWAILSAIHHEEVDSTHTGRVSQYKQWEDDLNFGGLEFPMEVDKIEDDAGGRGCP